MRPLAAVLMSATALVAGAAACGGSDAGNADAGGDAQRTRTVEVRVSVVDGRNPAGIEVAATGYVAVVESRFAVVFSGDGASYLGDTCDEAIEGAQRIADRLGTVLGPCEPIESATVEVADETSSPVDDDGLAVLRLLPDLRYEVGAGAPINPDDESGCVWNGVAEIGETVTDPIELHLDSDGCSGG